VIDVHVSRRRDIGSASRFFTTALTVHGDPGEVITDRAPALANVIEDLVPAALHNTGQYENIRVKASMADSRPAVDSAPPFRLATAFDELRPAI
jgi:transposase-like protein